MRDKSTFEVVEEVGQHYLVGGRAGGTPPISLEVVGEVGNKYLKGGGGGGTSIYTLEEVVYINLEGGGGGGTFYTWEVVEEVVQYIILHLGEAGLGTCSFQKNAMFLRSFPFFIKERNIFCVLSLSL